MKIVDIYPDPQNGLFTKVFKANFAEQYKAIFGDLDSVGLDTLVILECGEREMLNTITQENANTYVKNIISLSLSNWVKVANAYNTQYNVLEPTQKTTTRTNNATESENNTNTNVSSNKPYNETAFEEYDKDNNTSDKTRTNKTEVTESVTGLNGKSAVDELQKDIDFSLRNWRKSIIFAIINEVTKSIY